MPRVATARLDFTIAPAGGARPELSVAVEDDVIRVARPDDLA